jgi:DNA-binding MarR family transcriptional regulator
MKSAANKLAKPTVDEDSSVPALTGTLHFMQLLWELHHNLQARSKQMESALGVTGPQRLVVRLVGRHAGISAGELAALLHLHPSTLTGVLRRLEQHGLLHRRSDPKDGRRVLLTLTAAGRRVDARRSGTVESAVQQALSRLTNAERAAGERALEMLIDGLADPE